MTIKVYISGICGSHEVRKQQQRVLFILQSLPIELQIVDVTEPGRDEDLNFMQEEVKKHNKKTQLPPQIFNENEYCGDYTDFQLANDDDEVMKFLKLETGPSKTESIGNGKPPDVITQNGISDNNKDIADTVVQDISNDIDSVRNEQDVELSNTEINSDVVKDEEKERPIVENSTEALGENIEQSVEAPVEEKKANESAEEESEEEESE